jgi:hypothetical protein
MTVIHLDADIDAATSATFGLRRHSPANVNEPWLGMITIEGNGHTIDGKKRINSALRFHNRLDDAPRTSKIILRNLTLKNLNSSIGYGGGAIGVRQGELEIENCAFIGNSWAPAEASFEQRGGGAVYYERAGGILKITNSTFYGNEAIANKDAANAGSGGAVYLGGEGTITNCTIAGNLASNVDKAGDVHGGGIYKASGGTAALTLSNTIVAGNKIQNSSSPAIDDDVYDAASEGTPSIIDGNYNLIKTALTTGGASFTAAAGTSNGTVKDWSFLDSAPADNGGSTLTIALKTGNNDAVDKISGGAPEYDQRGYARDAAADIGAYEYNGAAPVSPATP